MATFVLSGSGRAHLPRGLMTITLQVEGATLPVVLAVTPRESVSQPRPGIAVIPNVAGRITVSAHAPDGTVFPNATVLQLTAVVNRGPEEDRVVVTCSDVAGIGSCELLTLETSGRGIVAYRQTEEADEPLTPLADASRVVTRQIVRNKRLDAAAARQLSILVDRSASMIPHASTVRAVVDILVGVAAVVSPTRRLSSVQLAGAAALPVGTDPRLTAESVRKVLDNGAMTTGFRSVERASGPVGREVRYVVTDTVPVDIDDLWAQADREESTAHLVAIISPDALEVLGEQRPLSCTYVAPAVGDRDRTQHLLSDPDLLRPIVESLVGGVWSGLTPPVKGAR